MYLCFFLLNIGIYSLLCFVLLTFTLCFSFISKRVAHRKKTPRVIWYVQYIKWKLPWGHKFIAVCYSLTHFLDYESVCDDYNTSKLGHLFFPPVFFLLYTTWGQQKPPQKYEIPYQIDMENYKSLFLLFKKKYFLPSSRRNTQVIISKCWRIDLM